MRYATTMHAHGYGLPHAPTNGKFEWGSNNLVLKNMVVVASAFDIAGDVKFRDGVLEGVGYILGRNALKQLYVTSYGGRASYRRHSRWYAVQLNPALPSSPPVRFSVGRTRQSKTHSQPRHSKAVSSSSATATAFSPGRRTS